MLRSDPADISLMPRTSRLLDSMTGTTSWATRIAYPSSRSRTIPSASMASWTSANSIPRSRPGSGLPSRTADNTVASNATSGSLVTSDGRVLVGRAYYPLDSFSPYPLDSFSPAVSIFSSSARSIGLGADSVVDSN